MCVGGGALSRGYLCGEGLSPGESLSGGFLTTGFPLFQTDKIP